MKIVFIAAHQGLGDHIVCNAIYRNFSLRAKLCLIPCTTQVYSQVRAMLRDLNNIVLIPILPSYPFFQTRLLIRIMKFIRIKVIRLGYFDKNFKKDDKKFIDQVFYEQAQINWHSRWQDFYFPSNLDRSNSLFKELNLSGSEYIFVHDDESRGMNIKDKYLNHNYKIVRPDYGSGYFIFDYTKIIEAAIEIHCIESSFAHLIDSMPGGPKLLFLHTYARPSVRLKKSNQMKYKKNWNII